MLPVQITWVKFKGMYQSEWYTRLWYWLCFGSKKNWLKATIVNSIRNMNPDVALNFTVDLLFVTSDWFKTEPWFLFCVLLIFFVFQLIWVLFVFFFFSCVCLCFQNYIGINRFRKSFVNWRKYKTKIAV